MNKKIILAFYISVFYPTIAFGQANDFIFLECKFRPSKMAPNGSSQSLKIDVKRKIIFGFEQGRYGEMCGSNNVDCVVDTEKFGIVFNNIPRSVSGEERRAYMYISRQTGEIYGKSIAFSARITGMCERGSDKAPKKF
jgi:hypothetical protein